MTLCEDGHAEICFDQKYCPLCKSIEREKELEETIKIRDKQIDSYREETVTLSAEISILERRIAELS